MWSSPGWWGFRATRGTTRGRGSWLSTTQTVRLSMKNGGLMLGAMRAVRYAVAVAYIFLFTGGPQGTQNNALVELAYRGAGMEERTPGQQGTEEQNPGDAVKKLRSYVDHVSTPFAADSESSKWTQDAIKEIREVVVTDQAQLSDL